MIVLNFASLKGGVAKTTDAAFTSLELARRFPGRVLVVDLDPNNNLTDLLLRNIPVEEIESRNVSHVLNGQINIKQAIYTCCLDEGLAVIPSVPELADVGKLLATKPGVLLKFPAALRNLNYDWIIIDSPPALTLELSLSLYSADYVVVPVKVNRWTLQAHGVVKKQVEEVKNEMGEGPIIRTLPSICTEKQNTEIRLLLPDFPFTESFIPKNAAIEAAVDSGMSLKIGSKAHIAVSNFVDEVITWQ